jgi:putative N-acetylmannosamine-6-phosphate epimerase
MAMTRYAGAQTTLTMLDTAAQAARSGFACMFSTSEEYEAALIAERRAEGRYSGPNYWPYAMFIGCALVIVGAVLLML